MIIRRFGEATRSRMEDGSLRVDSIKGDVGDKCMIRVIDELNRTLSIAIENSAVDNSDFDYSESVLRDAEVCETRKYYGNTQFVCSFARFERPDGTSVTIYRGDE